MNKLNKPEVLKDIVWVLIGVVIGILTSYGLVASSLKSTESEVASTKSTEEVTAISDNTIETSETEDETSSDESTGITTYLYEHTEVSDEQLSSIKERVIGRINDLRNSNSFVQVQTGESSYEAYFYNTNNECFVSTSDGTYNVVFRNDNKVVKYEDSTGAVGVGEDIDVLTIIENAVNAAGTSDIAKIYEYPHESSGEPYNEYRIDLLGDEGVRLCYTSLGEDFTNTMMENIKEQDPEWEPHLVIILYIPEDDTDRSFGAISLVVYDDEDSEYTSWDLLGWIDLGEWKLDNWWYDYDFSNADTEEFETHLGELQSTIETLIDNIPDDAEVNATGEVTEATADEPTEEVETESIEQDSIEIETTESE